MIGDTSTKGTDQEVLEQLLGRAGLPPEARAEQARVMLEAARKRAEERRTEWRARWRRW